MLKFIVLITAVLAFGDDPDIKKLQGTWERVSTTREGTEDADASGMTLKVDGTEVSWYRGDGTLSRGGSFTLDSKKTPKEMDITLKNGRIVRMTYELEGDKFKTCNYLDRENGGRPRSTTSKSGDGSFVAVYKRKK